MERTTTHNIKLYPTIIALYTELYKQATVKSTRHSYIPSSRTKLLICKFISWLQNKYNNQVGVDFLITYFEFQFNRYIGVNNSKFGKNAVNLEWLVGPKAIAVWLQRDPQKKRFIKYRIGKTCQVQLLKTFVLQTQKKVTVNNLRQQMLVNINAEEELEKQRYYNTKVGFLHCADMTTLFNSKSKFCAECSFKNLCLERLRLNYPNIYKIRNQ